MGLFNTILKAFVGDKAKKDLKLILPIVDEIKKIGIGLEKLTNDELRQRTNYFKKKIISEKKGINKEIEKIRIDISNSQDIVETQNLYTKIDKLEKLGFEKTNDILDEILPEAFAVVKKHVEDFIILHKLMYQLQNMTEFFHKKKIM